MLRPRLLLPKKCFVRHSSSSLKETLAQKIPARRDLLKRLRTEYGSKSIGDIKVENIVGGMRGLKAMVWEGSQVDPDEGIRFHGMTIAECQQALPKGTTGSEMLPESMFWLLLTGELPSETQVRNFSKDLAAQSELPSYVNNMLDGLPKSMHPMTQLSMAISSLNHDSSFAKQYEAGLNKAAFWEPTFDDTISLLAKLPTIVARIYTNTYLNQKPLGTIDPNMDLCHNLAKMMGRADDTGFVDCLRLYTSLHGDHEGGNLSAHTAHLVGSGLSDIFLAYSAAVQGLAGPLHGLAAQEVCRWIINMSEKCGDNPSDKDIEDFLWNTLNSGQVVPGYGHGVLRKPDPRFNAMIAFGLERKGISEYPLWQLVYRNSQIAPKVLLKHGKTKNPYPNVDSSSGVLFHYYGLPYQMYTVIFGFSRALCLSQVIWDRALGLPIERPKSLTLATIEKLAKGG